jgi:peptidoglycan/xylan/chitin deacetylase (PgdA/CDA1 family)
MKRDTRRLMSWIWIYFLYCTGLLRWAQRRIANSSAIVILTFHRVLEDAEFRNTNSPPGMVVRALTFKDCLDYIRGQYEIVSVSGESPVWDRKCRAPRVGVTFDDGWKDTSDIAYPISSDSGVPITVFVCPGLMGKSSPFWPEQVVRAWRKASASESESKKFSDICFRVLNGFSVSPDRDDIRKVEALIALLKKFPTSERAAFIYELSLVSATNPGESTDSQTEAAMTWQDCKALAIGATQIGSHGQSHEILPALAPQDAERELIHSKHEIERQLEVPCPLFAYPNGSWSLEVRDQVARARYSFAFINAPGFWQETTDRYLVPRVNIWEGLITGRRGNFSRMVFQYSVFWRSYRAQKQRIAESRSTVARAIPSP